MVIRIWRSTKPSDAIGFGFLKHCFAQVRVFGSARLFFILFYFCMVWYGSIVRCGMYDMVCLVSFFRSLMFAIVPHLADIPVHLPWGVSFPDYLRREIIDFCGFSSMIWSIRWRKSVRYGEILQQCCRYLSLAGCDMAASVSGSREHCS